MGEVILEADVVADRLGDDPGATNLDAPVGDLRDYLVPGPPPRRSISRIVPGSGLPGDERRIAAHVAVPHLQVHCRPLARTQQILNRRNRHCGSPPAGTEACGSGTRSPSRAPEGQADRAAQDRSPSRIGTDTYPALRRSTASETDPPSSPGPCRATVAPSWPSLVAM